MLIDEFSPYIRVASKSFFTAPFRISRRVIFDYEIILIESGKWALTVEDKVYICRENDVLLIRPGQAHMIESIGDIPVSQPHIHFDMIYDDFSEKISVSFKDLPQFDKTELRMIRADVFDGSGLNSPILTVPDLAYFKSVFLRSYPFSGRSRPCFSSPANKKCSSFWSVS